MIRAEIISNQSVQEDIIELLEQTIPNVEYTIIPTVYGKGISSKKLGNSTWPEQNFVLFSYMSKEDCQKLKEIVQSVKKRFPREGIVIHCTEEVEL